MLRVTAQDLTVGQKVEITTPKGTKETRWIYAITVDVVALVAHEDHQYCPTSEEHTFIPIGMDELVTNINNTASGQ